MKQQYCDNDLITFNLQGLLWISKENKFGYYRTDKESEHYILKLQYRTQSIEVDFPNEEIRNSAYEKARLLLTSKNEIKNEKGEEI